MIRHFLTLHDLTSDELHQLIARAVELKRLHKSGDVYQPLKNKVLAMIFDKSSTRTRVSFEAAMIQFGGSAIFLSNTDTQLGRGEAVADSARVISSMVDVVMIRTFRHAMVEQFSYHSVVPVINALTDQCHPCQLLADMQTYVEHRSSILGKTVAFIGDSNNMCHSYINAAELFAFNLNIATPEGYEPDESVIASSAANIQVFNTAQAAVKNVDLVVTDVWTSMGQEQEQKERQTAFADFQVDRSLMALAGDDALFMHCLPAHRGEEVAVDVIDSPTSVVWDEAENRLHSQKALLEFLCVS